MDNHIIGMYLVNRSDETLLFKFTRNDYLYSTLLIQESWSSIELIDLLTEKMHIQVKFIDH